MTKRQQQYLAWRKELDKTGWPVEKQDSIKGNHGSETAKHLHGKTATFRVLRKNGYRVSTEVEHPERGIVDVVAIPQQEGEKPFVVELETAPTDDVVSDKIKRYHDGTPFYEMYLIDVNALPMDIMEMEAHIADELGLTV